MSTSKESIRPVEGTAFKVNPQTINRKIFEKERSDKEQEKVRQHIVRVFQIVDANPEKYARPFEILIPTNIWKNPTTDELIKVSKTLGHHLTIGIEHILGWAQVLDNGESWVNFCNKPDNLKYHRLVEWTEGLLLVVGGAKASEIKFPATYVETLFTKECKPYSKLNRTVPSITCYSE